MTYHPALPRESLAAQQLCPLSTTTASRLRGAYRWGFPMRTAPRPALGRLPTAAGIPTENTVGAFMNRATRCNRTTITHVRRARCATRHLPRLLLVRRCRRPTRDRRGGCARSPRRDQMGTGAAHRESLRQRRTPILAAQGLPLPAVEITAPAARRVLGCNVLIPSSLFWCHDAEGTGAPRRSPKWHNTYGGSCTLPVPAREPAAKHHAGR